MGYYDFPHTNEYDRDLGFLIQKYLELNKSYEYLKEIYDEVKKTISDVTIEQLQKWLDDGTLERIINEGIFTKLDKYVVVPEDFGAVGDGETDDSISIQSYLDYCNNKFQTVKFPYGVTYKITKTLKFGNICNIDFNYSTLKFYNGEYTNKFAMLFASDDGVNSSYVNDNFMDTSNIRNLNIINVEVDSLKMAFVGCNSIWHTIRNWNFWQAIVWANNYIDVANIENFTCNTPKGSDYQFYKVGQGDLLKFKNVHIPTPTPKNTNGLYLGSSHGCVIEGWVNGNIRLNYCKATTIQSAHLEFGKIYLYYSDVTIKDCYIRKQLDSMIVLEDANSNLDVIKTNVQLINNQFILDYTVNNYESSNNDVDVTNFNGTLNLIGNKRITYCGRTNREYGSGINLFDTDHNVYVGQGVTTFTNKKIIAEKALRIPFNWNSGNSEGYYNILTSGATTLFGGNLSASRYVYAMIAVYDETRKLGSGFKAPGVNVARGTGTSVILIFNNDYSQSENIMMKIYKGVASRQYSSYANVSCCNALVDNGYSANGFLWHDRDSVSDVDTYNYCYGLQYVNGVNVIAYCKAKPTVGTWTNGDVVKDVTNATNGWYYNGSAWVDL